MADLLEGKGAFWLPLLLFVVVLVQPWAGLSAYWLREIPLIAIYVMLVSGLNLCFGYAGELQFSQIALYALGGYITATVATHAEADALLIILLSGVAASVIGLGIAIPALRIGGWSLAMASLFLVLIVPDLIAIFDKWTGGYIGLFGLPRATVFGFELDQRGFYVLTLIVAAVWIALFRNLVTSRYAHMFRSMRESPVLAASLGVSVRRTKMLAYALGSFPAGVAGALIVYANQAISPELFAVSVAIGILAASFLGGTESVYGAVVGGLLLQVVPAQLASFQEYSHIAFGVFLIVIAVLLRQGLKGLGERAARWTARRLRGGQDAPAPSVPHDTVELSNLPGKVLSVSNVVKRFGGVTALNDVTLECRPGEVSVLIGANGSGKTTLLNTISGFGHADQGTVRLGDAVLDGKRPHVLAAHYEVARTFQTPAVPRGMRIIDVVATGSYRSIRCGVASAMLRLPRHWRAEREQYRRAFAALNVVGLADQAYADASSMPLGSRRLIEVARCVVAEPSLLLLDEPASGLSPEEVDRLGELVRIIADAGGTVIMVEHNFKFVLGVADRIHVLELGTLIASGTPAEIEHDPRVAESYLGSAVALVEEEEDDEEVPSAVS